MSLQVCIHEVMWSCPPPLQLCTYLSSLPVDHSISKSHRVSAYFDTSSQAGQLLLFVTNFQICQIMCTDTCSSTCLATAA